jgi:hypothetical protein
MPTKKTKVITNKEELDQHPDHKIDQDFEGYPHGPANDETINPKTKQQRKTAATDIKDGEKETINPADRKPLEE